MQEGGGAIGRVSYAGTVVGIEAPEGSSRSRNVVIEFPSYQAALDCYRSAAYQDAMKLRLPVSTGDLVIIEGYDGPQPS